MLRRFSVLFLVCLFPVQFALASSLQVGDTFPDMRLADQHGEVAALPGDAELLLVSTERETSDRLNGYLEGRPGDFLAQRRARFIADISGMPSLITRMFALPAMRERPYPILLVEEAADLDVVPRQAGRLTVIRLHDGRVASIAFVSEAATLDRIFDTPFDDHSQSRGENQ